MRLISYNILDGGEGRADPLAEVIEAQRPDVVALVEADFAPTTERIANRLKMDFIHAPGNKGSVALLSRWPIRESINHAPLRPKLSKSLLEAVVVDPATGADWTIGVLHLHAHAAESDEQHRETEIAQVLDVFQRHRHAGRPHLLCGDFNSNAPIQRLDPAKLKESSRKEWEQNGNRIPRRVVQRLLDAGYVDTLAAVKGDAAGTIGTFSTQFPEQRVDYVFAFRILPQWLKDAWVEHDRLATYASDHYPIGVEIDE